MLCPRKPSTVLALASKLRHIVPTRNRQRQSRAQAAARDRRPRVGPGPCHLGAYSAVRPAAGQETYPEPSEFVSQDGVVQVQLTAAEQQIELAGTPVAARVYNGGFVGPTMRWARATRSSWSWSTRCPSRPTSTSTACTFRLGRIRQRLAARHGWRNRPVRVEFPATTPRHLLVPLAPARDLGGAGLRRYVRGDRGRGIAATFCPKRCRPSSSASSR